MDRYKPIKSFLENIKTITIDHDEIKRIAHNDKYRKGIYHDITVENILNFINDLERSQEEIEKELLVIK